ncbi:hypothetical protein [Streptomyces sp. NPDC051909]
MAGGVPAHHAPGYDIAGRFAETDHDADELFARTWLFVEHLALAPDGF